MTTLAQVYGLAHNMPPALRQRVEAAVIEQVDAILQEDAGTTNHANRLSLAQACLVAEARQKVVSMLLSTGVTNGTLQAQGDAIADSDLRWLVGFYFGMASFVAGAQAGLA
jgi:hypothetical protein